MVMYLSKFETISVGVALGSVDDFDADGPAADLAAVEPDQDPVGVLLQGGEAHFLLAPAHPQSLHQRNYRGPFTGSNVHINTSLPGSRRVD